MVNFYDAEFGLILYIVLLALSSYIPCVIKMSVKNFVQELKKGHEVGWFGLIHSNNNF